MKNLIIILFCLAVASCSQRVEIDPNQWGNKSDVSNIQIFKLEVDDNPSLYETVTGVGQVAGVRRLIISSNVVIDNEAKTVTLSLLGNETLNEAGILIYHNAQSVEPLDNAPIAGLVSNLTDKSFKYRLHSANGDYTDWTITIK